MIPEASASVSHEDIFGFDVRSFQPPLILQYGLYGYTDGVCDALRPITISNGNRTEWSPIRSVIIRVITKADDRAAGVRFVYHEYDYRPNWTPLSPIIN